VNSRHHVLSSPTVTASNRRPTVARWFQTLSPS
jgi:hypothetical protein